MLESFFNILNGEKADEIVWTGDILYWLASQTQASAAFRELNNEQGYLRFCKELGICQREDANKFKVTRSTLPEDETVITVLSRA